MGEPARSVGDFDVLLGDMAAGLEQLTNFFGSKRLPTASGDARGPLIALFQGLGICLQPIASARSDRAGIAFAGRRNRRTPSARWTLLASRSPLLASALAPKPILSRFL